MLRVIKVIIKAIFIILIGHLIFTTAAQHPRATKIIISVFLRIFAIAFLVGMVFVIKDSYDYDSSRLKKWEGESLGHYHHRQDLKDAGYTPDVYNYAEPRDEDYYERIKQDATGQNSRDSDTKFGEYSDIISMSIAIPIAFVIILIFNKKIKKQKLAAELNLQKECTWENQMKQYSPTGTPEKVIEKVQGTFNKQSVNSNLYYDDKGDLTTICFNTGKDNLIFAKPDINAEDKKNLLESIKQLLEQRNDLYPIWFVIGNSVMSFKAFEDSFAQNS